MNLEDAASMTVPALRVQSTATAVGAVNSQTEKPVSRVAFSSGNGRPAQAAFDFGGERGGRVLDNVVSDQFSHGRHERNDHLPAGLGEGLILVRQGMIVPITRLDAKTAILYKPLVNRLPGDINFR
jgi:hypothetical protein